MNEPSYDFKKSIRTYIAILLTYVVIVGITLLGSLLFIVVEVFIPLMMILLTPLHLAFLFLLGYGAVLGLAYIASSINKAKIEPSKLSSAFQTRNLPNNALTLFIRWVAIGVFAIPPALPFLFLLLIPEFFESFPSVPAFILFWILIFIPAMIVDMLLSMVPYLLADPDFDPRGSDAIRSSIRMIKPRFFRIFALRFVFLLWFIALGLSLPFYTVEVFADAMGGREMENLFGPFQDIFEVAVLTTVLLVIPLYRMMHGVIYTKLKPRQKTGIPPSSARVSLVDPEKS